MYAKNRDGPIAGGIHSKEEAVVDKMDVRSMEYFHAVAQTRSFSKAASQLYVSRQAVSKAMSDLENEVGVPLFQRGFNGVELTEDGEYLEQRTIKTLQMIRETEETLKMRSEKAVKEIRLAFSFGTQSVFFNQIDAFEKKKNVHLSISDHNDAVCEEMLLSDQADLITTALPVQDEQYMCMPIFDSDILMAVPDGHRLYTKEEIDIHDLDGETMITLPDCFYAQRMMMQCMEEAGVHPIIASQTSNLTYLLELVRRSKGISPLAEYATVFASQMGIRCIPVKGREINWTLYAVWKKSENENPILKMLLKEIFSINI